MQGAGVRIFEVLVMAVLRLLATRLGPARGALCGLILGALASIQYLTVEGKDAADALATVLLTLGTAGLGASIGLRLPSLLRSHLRRRELSGPLGPAWDKLTRDLMKIAGREDLAEDPRRQRLIEAYADAFAELPTSPEHAKERMAEAIALSKDLLERNGPGGDKVRNEGLPEDPPPPATPPSKEKDA
jgi:hypothetical protein